jgi:hypothetical protein
MDMISIGLVAESGEELYRENLDFIQSWSSPWVRQNIYPLLDATKHGAKRFDIIIAIEGFVAALDCDAVEFCADYQGDLDILENLLEDAELTKPVAYTNFRNTIYYRADAFTKIVGGSDSSYQLLVKKAITDFEYRFKRYFDETGEIQHHALSDARANKIAFNYAMMENHLAF